MAREGIELIIDKQMRDKGITEYHIEPFFVNDPAAAVVVNAPNEYWYLVSAPALVPVSFLLVSDTEVMSDAADYANLNYAGVRPHTGRLQLSQAAGPVKAEFLRVRISAQKRKKTHEAVELLQLVTGNLILDQVAPQPMITNN